MRQAGSHNVDVLRVGQSLPYAYGEWLEAPGKPTVFLYAHHDVQPINFVEQWQSDPWKLTRRDGRLYARGAADDKGAIAAQLAAVAAYRKTGNNLPVNIKMLVEGEEEVGSKNLLKFFETHRDRLKSDVIVVCDTENIEVGIPSITYSLRGIVAVKVEVTTAKTPGSQRDGRRRTPGRGHRAEHDSGPPLLGQRPAADPRYYDQVRPLTEKEKAAFAKLPFDSDKAHAIHRHGADSAVAAMEKGYDYYGQNLATTRGDRDRARSEFDQGRVESGAAEGVGHRELPHRAGP